MSAPTVSSSNILRDPCTPRAAGDCSSSDTEMDSSSDTEMESTDTDIDIRRLCKCCIRGFEQQGRRAQSQVDRRFCEACEDCDADEPSKCQRCTKRFTGEFLASKRSKFFCQTCQLARICERDVAAPKGTCQLCRHAFGASGSPRAASADDPSLCMACEPRAACYRCDDYFRQRGPRAQSLRDPFYCEGCSPSECALCNEYFSDESAKQPSTLFPNRCNECQAKQNARARRALGHSYPADRPLTRQDAITANNQKLLDRAVNDDDW